MAVADNAQSLAPNLVAVGGDLVPCALVQLHVAVPELARQGDDLRNHELRWGWVGGTEGQRDMLFSPIRLDALTGLQQALEITLADSRHSVRVCVPVLVCVCVCLRLCVSLFVCVLLCRQRERGGGRGAQNTNECSYIPTLRLLA